MVGFEAVLLTVAVLWVVFGVILPIWVYRDATRRHVDSPVLWALVTFFGGPLGFLLYVLLGRE